MLTNFFAAKYLDCLKKVSSALSGLSSKNLLFYFYFQLHYNHVDEFCNKYMSDLLTGGLIILLHVCTCMSKSMVSFSNFTICKPGKHHRCSTPVQPCPHLYVPSHIVSPALNLWCWTGSLECLEA